MQFLRDPVFEYYRRQAIKLGLPVDLCFDEPSQAERILVNRATGQKITWDGERWVDYKTGAYVDA